MVAQGADNVISGNSQDRFIVTDLVKADLIDQISKCAERFSYHSLVCTFGDSFHCPSEGFINLETVLTSDQEQGTQSLFDGMLSLEKAPSVSGMKQKDQGSKVRLKLRPRSTKVEPFFVQGQGKIEALVSPMKFGSTAFNGNSHS